jgi:hypothetical protein
VESCRGAQFADAGIPVVLTPARAPNAHAYAKRFVRSINEECLNRMIPKKKIGEGHFRYALKKFVEHYHRNGITKGSTTASSWARRPIERTSRVRRRLGSANYSTFTSAQPDQVS